MSQKRSIFEEVGEKTSAKTSTKIQLDRDDSRARGRIRAWLAVLFGLVVLMIAVGGLTRLTDSGLSITEWRPVTGAIPPLNAQMWDFEFEKYKQIPEYQLQNKGMTMAEFKVIYWWEWGHRQLGRVIGLVWTAGFVFFWATKQIPAGWTGRLAALGALGGMQGAIGWWMVHSGLGGTMTDVASYRLATHLGIAFFILSLIAWFMFKLARSPGDILQARRGGDAKLFGLSTGLLHLAGVQIILGALVAGIDAGRSYTDWPLMAGQVFPAGELGLTPLWRNFFESAGLVQFNHRIVGYVLAVMAFVVWRKGRSNPNGATRRAYDLMFAAVVAQIVLGIVTVVTIVPWQLAILHQFGAVIVITLVLRARFMARYPLPQSLRTA